MIKEHFRNFSNNSVYNSKTFILPFFLYFYSFRSEGVYYTTNGDIDIKIISQCTSIP